MEEDQLSGGDQQPKDQSTQSDTRSLPPATGAEPRQEQSVRSTSIPSDPNEEVRPSGHAVRIWRFLIDPRHSNAVVAIFTLLLFITTTIYTVFAALQWLTMKNTLNEMKSSGTISTDQTWRAIENMNWLARTMDGSLKNAEGALSLAHENFRQEQRPYLWHTHPNDEAPTYFERSHQVAWNWHFSNFGRSPAYHILIQHKLTLGVGNPVKGFRVPRHSDGAPLPPGQDRWATAGSETTVSAEEFNRLLSETDSIELHVVLLYRDSYGTIYTTKICARHLKTGATQYCDTGNSIE